MSKSHEEVSVLVIEDVEEMRALFEHILSEIEGVVLSGAAGNGSEARVVVSKRRPDLVFLDEVLPGESSLDLLSELTSQGILVALITSMENPSQTLPHGAIRRLAKPGWKSLNQDRDRLREFIFSVGR